MCLVVFWCTLDCMAHPTPKSKNLSLNLKCNTKPINLKRIEISIVFFTFLDMHSHCQGQKISESDGRRKKIRNQADQLTRTKWRKTRFFNFTFSTSSPLLRAHFKNLPGTKDQIDSLVQCLILVEFYCNGSPISKVQLSILV